MALKLQAEGHELAYEDVDKQKHYLAPVFKFDEEEFESTVAEAGMMDDVLNGKKVSGRSFFVDTWSTDAVRCLCLNIGRM